MKALPAIFAALIAGLVVFFVQEKRIEKLEGQLAETVGTSKEQPRSSSPSNRSASGLAQNSKPAKSTRKVSDTQPGEEDTKKDAQKEDSTARSMSGIFESEAGQAMMKQGIKQAIPQFYGHFIEKLELNQEEAEYFNNLLTERMASQQILGMEWMAADEQGKLAVEEKMEASRLANTGQIEEFLQSSEDSAAFKKYELQLPENRQMQGIRNAFSNDPLSTEIEQQLVDTMYQARLNSGEGAASDDDNWQTIATTGSLESIEARWTATDAEIARTLPDVLTSEQSETFLTHWEQARALIKMEYQMGMQVMGLQKKE